MKFDKDLLQTYQAIVRDPEVDPVFNSFYQEAKAKFQELFDKVFTLEHFDEQYESFQKLKSMLIDRYAKLFALANYTSKKNTPLTHLPSYAIDAIFETFGFTFHKALKDEDKRLIVQNIVDLINTKGTRSLENVLQILLRFTDIEIMDLDLVLDSTDTWNLVNVKTGYRYRLQKIPDNHWLTDLDELKTRCKKNNIPPQFRTPFFTLTANKENLDKLTKLILFINVIVRDELRNYLKTGSFTSQIYIDIFNINISITELWLFLITLYKTYIAVTTGNEDYLNPLPSTVYVFDEDIKIDASIKKNAFKAIAKISLQSLKELTFQFYMEHFEELETISLEQFDSYLASTWEDYYALEKEVRNALIVSAFFYMKLAKHEITDFYIEDLWDSLTRLPYDYIEKYVSCDENPEKGLLYVFYDHFTKNYNDNSSEIVSKIIRNAEGQLSIINNKLIRFKNLIVEKYRIGEVTKQDFQALIGYFLLKLSEYLFMEYTIRFPINVFFGVALNYYTRDIINKTLDELKPTYTRPIFGASTTKFEINNPLLESIKYLLKSKLIIWQLLYDSCQITDALQQVIKLRFADIVNNITHTYKFLDPNFLTYVLNRGINISIYCCNSEDPYCFSNIKYLKEHWKCCTPESLNPNDDVREELDVVYACNWCLNSSLEHEVTYYNAQNAIYNSDVVYNIWQRSVSPEEFAKVIAENAEQCITDYVYDGSIIQTIRYDLSKSTKGIYDQGRFDVALFDSDTVSKCFGVVNKYLQYEAFSYEDPSHSLNTAYFDRFKIILNKSIEEWWYNAIKIRPIYSVLDIVDDWLNDQTVSFLSVTGEILNLVIHQKIWESLTYVDFIGNINAYHRFKDTVSLNDLILHTVTQRKHDILSTTDATRQIVDLYNTSLIALDDLNKHTLTHTRHDNIHTTMSCKLNTHQHLHDDLFATDATHSKLKQITSDPLSFHSLSKIALNLNLSSHTSLNEHAKSSVLQTFESGHISIRDKFDLNLVGSGKYDEIYTRFDSSQTYG